MSEPTPVFDEPDAEPRPQFSAGQLLFGRLLLALVAGLGLRLAGGVVTWLAGFMTYGYNWPEVVRHTLLLPGAVACGLAAAAICPRRPVLAALLPLLPWERLINLAWETDYTPVVGLLAAWVCSRARTPGHRGAVLVVSGILVYAFFAVPACLRLTSH